MKKYLCAYCNKNINIKETVVSAEGYFYHVLCFDKTVLGKRIIKKYREFVKEFNKYEYI